MSLCKLALKQVEQLPLTSVGARLRFSDGIMFSFVVLLKQE